jgi:L-ribulose-5-phosphate 4-epimerase
MTGDAGLGTGGAAIGGVVTDEEDERIAEEAAQVNLVLAETGQADLVWGHVSLRDPHGRGVWMKAATWGFEEVTSRRVVLVSPDGEVLWGEGRRHIEFPIHAEIMLARPDVNCVVHTHSSAAVEFASLDVPIRAISHAGVEYALLGLPRFMRTGGLIKNRDLGRSLAETLGEATASLLPQHGMVTIGDSAAAAIMRAVRLEMACAQQLRVMAAGGPALWSGEAELQEKEDEVWSAAQLQIGYDYLRRKSEKRIRAAAVGE